MESCILIPAVEVPDVQNPDTKQFVSSILFKDLLDYTDDDRTIAKQQYVIAKKPETIKKLGRRARFDRNGELTIKSLLEYTKLDINEVQVMANLNKRLVPTSTTELPFEEASAKIAAFNRDNQQNDYMATLTRSQKNSSMFIPSIVKRTLDEQVKLENVILNVSLGERLVSRLQQLGMSTKVLTDGTIEAYDAYLGMNAIINDRNLDQSLESVAKLIVGLSKGTPLYNRFINSIPLESLSESTLDEDPRELRAIEMVKDALMDREDIPSSSKSLFERLKEWVKMKLSRIGKSSLQADLNEAKIRANQILEDFGTSRLVDTRIVEARKIQLERNKQEHVNTKLFKQIINTLSKQYEEMTIINKDNADKYKKLAVQVSQGRIFTDETVFADRAALDGIIDAIGLMSDNNIDMLQMLTSIDVSTIDLDGPYEKIAADRGEMAKRLREVRNFTKYASQIATIIRQAVVEREDAGFNKKNKLIGFSEEEMSHLKAINNTLEQQTNLLTSSLLTKELDLYSNFLTEHMGQDYVTRATRVLFDSDSKFWRQRIKVVKGGETKLRDMLQVLQQDDNAWERWLNSMSNSSDITNQLAERGVKLAYKKADDNMNELLDRLRDMKRRMEEEFGSSDTRDFFEISKRNNELTGNLISERNWGDWENDYDTFKKEEKEKFLTSLNIKNKSELEISLLWDSYFRPLSKAWHKTHSSWDEIEEMYIPNRSYLNKEYDKIRNTPREKYLKEFLEIKNLMEVLLPENSARKMRAPQFKGRVIHQYLNRAMNNNKFKSTFAVIGKNMRDTFVENSDDIEFGSDGTYNKLQDDMFHNEEEFQKEKINRLPIYGINKLKNINDLSTDLFQSMMHYGTMVFTYDQMNTIVNVMEVGKSALQERKVSGSKTEAEYAKVKGRSSNAYSRYIKYLDMQVYNIGHPGLHRKGVKTIAKIAKFLSSLAGKALLGGNVTGGMVNVLQGMIEINKEAVGGEFFSMKDLVKANKIYFAESINNLQQLGKEEKDDKVTLLIRQFNIQQKNREKAGRFRSSKGQFWHNINPIGDKLFMPYELGERYMQTVGYLAQMINTTVKEDLGGGNYGPSINLYDAYETVPINPSSPEAGYTLKLKGNFVYKDKITGNWVKWDQRAENNFMSRAREVNNRLHGIYNKEDKTAFQQTIFGSMLLSMRGYALGMANRRFGRAKYSTALGGEVEGNLVTLGKLLHAIVGDEQNRMLLIKGAFIPGRFEEKLTDYGFTANQVANIRRTHMDTFYIAMTLALGILFKALDGKLDDDDDEEGSMLWGICYYLSSRLNTEQSALSTIWGAKREIQTLSSITPVGVSFLYDVIEITKHLITQEEYQGGPNDEKKKWKVKSSKLIPYYKSWLLMQYPYKAAESYQYGRVTMNK